MAVTLDGIYLEDNAPKRSQFRRGRRASVKPVIVVHTAESGIGTSDSEPKAENVALSIRRRTRPRSYHLLGDADSIIQLVRFENEACQDGSGSNPWAISISLAMNAADWPKLSPARSDELIETAAQMADIAARWLKSQGHGFPEPRLLTKTESDRSTASGFISHARREPGRSGPGAGFPWSDFFIKYKQFLTDGGFRITTDSLIRELQRVVGVKADGIVADNTMAALNKNWLGGADCFDPSVAATFTNDTTVIRWVQRRLDSRDGLSVKVDGYYGPRTAEAAKSVLGQGGVIAAESFLALAKV